MTSTDAKRGAGLRVVVALLLSAMLACTLPCSLSGETRAFADSSASASAGASTSASGDAQARYTNPDTGFQVVVIDERELLSSEEEGQLVEDMKPVTAYGNVAFWSTDEYTVNEIEQARVKRKALFEFESATIFVINTKRDKRTIQSYGKMYEGITDSRARSITDNVKPAAKRGEYYESAKECYTQIYAVMEGEDIPEPMKFAGYVVLAVILGFTIVVSIAFSRWLNPLRVESEEVRFMQGSGKPCVAGKTVTLSEHVRTKSSGGVGGCGGGGCGGGGCGGGCGGGGSS